jgi:hypothetical protein
MQELSRLPGRGKKKIYHSSTTISHLLFFGYRPVRRGVSSRADVCD